MITGVNPCCWIVDTGLSTLAKLNWSLTIVHFCKTICANNKQKVVFFAYNLFIKQDLYPKISIRKTSDSNCPFLK